MAILGIGNDIVEVERVRAVLNKHQERFLSRIFTNNEQSYCQKRKDPVPHYAGRFAAKEAVVKALGMGFRFGISWKDVEISHDKNGKPLVTLSPLIIELCGDVNILISISHCHKFATAFAISVDKKNNISLN